MNRLINIEHISSAYGFQRKKTFAKIAKFFSHFAIFFVKFYIEFWERKRNRCEFSKKKFAKRFFHFAGNPKYCSVDLFHISLNAWVDLISSKTVAWYKHKHIQIRGNFNLVFPSKVLWVHSSFLLSIVQCITFL